MRWCRVARRRRSRRWLSARNPDAFQFFSGRIPMKSFESLSEREILALAIGLEEEDARVYGDFADGLRERYPATAQIFEKMRQEEITHRQRLFEKFRERFGEHIPLIR